LADNQNHEPPERTVGSARGVRRLPEGGVTEPVVEFIWHDSPVPAGLPVTQVYGWLLCPVTGRVLIQEHDDGVRSLPGGSPEAYDANMEATLARESFEENQVRIAPGPAYLGYQEVIEPGRRPYAQVRMAGIIVEFAPRGPDPDNGRINQRLMTSLAAAPGSLGWGQPAEAQARGAARAGRQWGLPVDNPAPDSYAD
jgi:8-oxo-dGTP diphosphatase